jgi:ribonuclease HII
MFTPWDCTKELSLAQMTLANRLGVIGVDEVGTGALAGPLLVCATLVPLGYGNPRVRDSKQIDRPEIHRLALELIKNVQWVCVQATAATINAYGPKPAWDMAVCEALFRLRSKCGIIREAYIDGSLIPDGVINAKCVIRGDSQHFQIAAAAIIAKHFRLKIMRAIHKLHPQYGFDTSDGYGVPAHKRALQHFGPTPYHRTKATGTLLSNSNHKNAIRQLHAS